MHSRPILAGILFAFFLAGCQTTNSEGTEGTSETAVSAPAPEKAQTDIAAIPDYMPVDGEKFTYVLVSPHKEIPAKQYKVLKDTIENGLRDAGKLAEDGTSAKQVEVLFTRYRMRSPGTRWVFSGLAGKDRIETMVHIKDSASGEILSSQFFRTGSATGWRGIGKILKRHADKVVAYVANGKKK